MTQQQVIERYCMLSAKVAEEVFDYQHAADCFCKPAPSGWEYRYEEAVIKFIEDAVQEKIASMQVQI